MSLVWFLLIGGVAGWLAGMFMKGRSFGIVMNVVVGVVGAVVGGFLFGLLGFAAVNTIGSLITAFVGSVMLLFVVSKLKK